MKRLTSLSHHVIQFGRFLRTNQFNIGPDEETDALNGLTHINWHHADELKSVLKTTMCKDFNQHQAFDKLYNQYWWEIAKAVDSKQKQVEEEKDKPTKSAIPSIDVIKSWLNGNQQPQEDTDLTKASSAIQKSTVNLSPFASDYSREWREVVLLIKRYIAKKKSRRLEKANQPGTLDFRGVLKESMNLGGEVGKFVYRDKKINQTRIVLLCDVSKSMELYSRFVIQMMYALQNSGLRLDCFVFSTSLYSVSRKLKTNNINQALDSLGKQIEEWSSGTTIGSCLHDFLEKYGRKLLHKNTFAFIVSDGWDSGDIDLLDSSLKKLKRRIDQLIWINPLATSSDFHPEVLGMKAALPYIDHLIPALDVTTFKKYLSRLRA